MPLTVERIAEALTTENGIPVSSAQIEWLADAGGASQLADSTSKFLVPLGPIKGFMIVSGRGNCALVRRAVENIEMARSLAGSASEAILPPVLSGEIDGRSFAVWERQKPFPTGNIGKRLVRLLYGARILNWALDLCVNTARPAMNVQEQYERPLLALESNKNWPSAMRRDAEAGLRRIGEWRPQQCVQHGDFWLDNVLRSRGGRIAVVDWGGANINGYPVNDMARMLMSLNSRPSTGRYYMDALCSALACDRRDLVSYSLSAIGKLGENLEHFPESKYREVGIALHRQMVDWN